jgi:hypothetical protein
MSSSPTKRSYSHNGVMRSAHISEKLLQQSATAARPLSAVTWSMWNSAIRAGIASSRIIRVAIGIAQSAKRWSAPNGWPKGKPSSCPFRPSMSSLRCRNRLAAWRSRMRARSTTSCFAPLRKRYSPSQPIPTVWALRSGSSPFCTLGAEPSSSSTSPLHRARRRHWAG